MKFANATKLDRKSGVAQWRDLLFLFCPSDLTALTKSHDPPLVIPSALRISYYAALINAHVCGFL